MKGGEYAGDTEYLSERVAIEDVEILQNSKSMIAIDSVPIATEKKSL